MALKQSETSETAAASAVNSPLITSPGITKFVIMSTTTISDNKNEKPDSEETKATSSTATKEESEHQSEDKQYLSIIQPSTILNRQQTPSTLTPISVVQENINDQTMTTTDTITDGVDFGNNDLQTDLSASISYDDEISDCDLSFVQSPELPDNLTMTQLLMNLTEVDEDLTLEQHGYTRIRKICDTLQGELIEAEVKSDENNSAKKRTISSDHKENVNGPKQIERVAIKRTRKELFREKIAEYDGMTFCVEENIVKEALILHHLTIDNRSTANYVVRFVEFFESDEHFYLVMEYIEGCNLLQFVEKAHEYINKGQLKVKEYHKIVKYIFWQLSAVLYWLHNDMSCK